MSTDRGETPYSLLPPGLSRSGLLDLYRVLARARELERVTEGAAPSREPFPALAALGVTWPLRKGPPGSGDLLGMAVRSPVAALAHGLPPEVIIRNSHRPPVASPGRDDGGDWIDLSLGVLGPEAPPGVLLGVMAGAAMAFRLRDQPRAGLFLGGAAGSAAGGWHEALNLAAVQRAPLVAVILVRPGDPAPGPGRIPTGASLPAERGRPYGLDTVAVDGNDLPGALDAVSAALSRAREGGGTTLVQVTAPPECAPGDAAAAFRAHLCRFGPDLPGEVSVVDAAAREEMEEAARVAAREEPHGAELSTRGSFFRPVPRVSPLLRS